MSEVCTSGVSPAMNLLPSWLLHCLVVEAGTSIESLITVPLVIVTTVSFVPSFLIVISLILLVLPAATAAPRANAVAAVIRGTSTQSQWLSFKKFSGFVTSDSVSSLEV